MSSELAKWYHSMTFIYADEWDDSVRVVGKYLIVDDEVYDITNDRLVINSDKVTVKHGVLMTSEMKHGSVNTWDDWHLIPTSRPVFQQGKVKTTYVDIPGADGQIDLTEALSGYPTYNNREGSLEFIVANGYRKNWATGFSQFANWLHGRRLRVILDDDPEYFYEGRLSLNEWKSNNDGTWSNVTIDYNLKPYKDSVYLSTDKWLWDPFSFETGFAYNGGNISVNGKTTVQINNDAMHVVPYFIIKNTTDTKWTIELNGNTIELSLTFNSNGECEYRSPVLELLPGVNDVTITPETSGVIDILFRGGSL